MADTANKLDHKGASTHHEQHGAPNSPSGMYPITSGESNKTTDNYNGGFSMSRFITPGGNPIDNSQPAFPVYHRQFANPAPLGLLTFAACAFLVNLFNLQARGVTVPNLILGMALGYGGIGQTLAGLGEWACGNTFAATSFTSYGCFWFSFAVLYIPQFKVAAAYADDPVMLENAIGLYLAAWAMLTFIFLIAALRSSIALIALFSTLDLMFWLLAAGYLSQNESVLKAGAGFGLVTSCCGAYVALAGLLTKDTGYFMLPVGNLAPIGPPAGR